MKSTSDFPEVFGLMWKTGDDIAFGYSLTAGAGGDIFIEGVVLHEGASPWIGRTSSTVDWALERRIKEEIEIPFPDRLRAEIQTAIGELYDFRRDKKPRSP